MADIDLFDNWFRVADKDRDGVVSGGEAVEFFQRSQLPQATLFKVLLPRSYPNQNHPHFNCLLVGECLSKLQSSKMLITNSTTTRANAHRSGTWWLERVPQSTSHSSIAHSG